MYVERYLYMCYYDIEFYLQLKKVTIDIVEIEDFERFPYCKID